MISGYALSAGTTTYLSCRERNIVLHLIREARLNSLRCPTFVEKKPKCEHA
jgi:hypothetical protein